MTSLYFGNVKTNYNISVFGDSTLRVTPRLDVYGGVRAIYDHRGLDTTDADFFGSSETTLCSPADPGGHESSDKTPFTGRLGGQYQLSSDSNLYGTFSRGYKSGGFNPAACGNSYAPETVNALEIGSKNRFLDRRLSLNFAAYYYDFHNLQVEQVVNTESVIDNVPLSRIYGAEASGEWRITQNLSIDGNFSLLHARYVKFSYLDQLNPALGDQDLAGKPLNRSPNVSGNFGAQYTYPFDLGTFIARADVYATARFALSPANQAADFQSAYSTLGASLTYLSPDKTIRVRGWVKNATNQPYLEGLFAIPLFGLGREGIYGVPRTFGIELTKSFD